jgi:hypothetical protein
LALKREEAMMRGTAVFLDTSIQIAMVVHSKEAKRKISERIKEYDIRATSEVVRQEFKRRLLKEAKYLMDQLNRRGSFDEVFYHVERLPEVFHKRKKHICLQLFGTLFDGETDGDRTERMKLRLHYLLTLGLKSLDKKMDQVIKGSGCACNKIPIRVKERFARYEFGTERCSETGNQCGIVDYLISQKHHMRVLYDALRVVPDSEKSNEIRRSEEFLKRVLIDPGTARSQNPCLTVGDLIIALESNGIPTFYTLNQKESQFFCAVLGQELIVRPIDALKDDVRYVSTGTSNL